MTKLYVDFRHDDTFDIALSELSRTLLRQPRVTRPLKRDASTLVSEAGAGTQLRERYAELRAVLGSVTNALEDYADVVYALSRAGRWSTVIGVAEPPELSHAEAQARRSIRIYNSRLSDALAAIRHVVQNVGVSHQEQEHLREILKTLETLAEFAANSERAVAEIRRGKSPRQMNGRAWVDQEVRLRVLLGNER